VAVIGALTIGEWVEAALVVGLFGLGESLEGWAVDKSRRSVRGLMELAPEEATLVEAGTERIVPVGEVEPGAVIAVRPGGRIPLDAVVLAGESALDESALTGEFLPARKTPGDRLLAGSMNGEGYLEARVTSVAGATTLDRITRLVQDAQADKAPAQRWVDGFARYYTPAVIAVAALTAFLPPLLLAASFSEWLYKGLALLILACPCALVLSTPVAIVSALGTASRHGVLVKGGAHLEAAASADVVAFDKTGTLTKGRPVVVDTLVFDGLDRQTVLALAASVEHRSEHPLARALVEAAQSERLALYPVPKFTSVPGRGATGTVEGVEYRVGSLDFLSSADDIDGADGGGRAAAQRAWAGESRTLVALASPDRILGAFALADEVRPGAREALADLKSLGVAHTLLLTGDGSPGAGLLADALGIDDHLVGLLPEDKAQAVRTLEEAGNTVVMVGDGVNDAPALAAATVGIAMGGAKNDVALETSDITLMHDDLTRVPYVLSLARRTLSIVRQNIGFALALKVAAAALVFPGLLTLWMAVLVDAVGSLLVIGNGLRLVGYAPTEYAPPCGPSGTE
jgi:Cd2+/Zn2+-exporting ATPase